MKMKQQSFAEILCARLETKIREELEAKFSTTNLSTGCGQAELKAKIYQEDLSPSCLSQIVGLHPSPKNFAGAPNQHHLSNSKVSYYKSAKTSPKDESQKASSETMTGARSTYRAPDLKSEENAIEEALWLFKTYGENVTENVTAKDVKTAFRSLAAKIHPDKGGSNRQFQALKRAYDCLLNYCNGR